MSTQPIDTDGGSYVSGNVQADHDFIGRDKNIFGDEVHGDKVAGNKIVGYTAEQVAVIIAEIRHKDQPKRWNGRNPYVGLDAFRQDQANLFFGRNKLIAYLLDHLKTSRFLCITGPSGSGKSSLVQAGLLPALHDGKIAGSEQWLIETINPGNQPLENLALAVGRIAKSPMAAAYLRDHGANNRTTLLDQLETLLGHHPSQRALIVVDQFEELFTQTKDEAVRQALLELITYAAQEPNGRVLIVLVMRSDFVSQCANYPELRNLISGNLELVGAMDPPELAQAIVLPALEVGIEVKPDLVAQIINDMRGEPGVLPLMQFALKDLFDAQVKQPESLVVLTLEEYLKRGGIWQTLERHADARFAKYLSEEKQQQIVRKLFMSLVEIGQGAIATRRSAAFAELSSLDPDPAQVENVIQVLADARLITTDTQLEGHDTNPAQDSRSITIAHEKLIEAWPWLQQLVRENRALIELQNQISEDAAKWEKSNREPSYLYTGTELQSVQEQLKDHGLTLNPLAQQLIENSLARAKAELEREQALAAEREVNRQRELEDQQKLAAEQSKRADAEQRRTQLFRWATAVVTLLLFIASGFGWWGWRNSIDASNNEASAVAAGETSEANAMVAGKERDRANQQADIAETRAVEAQIAQSNAEEQAAVARSRQLAAQSTSELSNNKYEPAILLAIESGRNAGTVEAFSAIRQVIANPNHSRIVLYGYMYPSVEVTWSKDESKILISSDANTVSIFDALNGSEIIKFVGHRAQILEATWNQDESKISTISRDGTLRIWDTSTGEELFLLHGKPNERWHAVWSRDGRRLLVSGNRSNFTNILDTTSGTESIRLEGHTDPVHFALWSMDESMIVTSSEDKTIRIWDAQTGGELVRIQTDTRWVNQITWSQDNTRLLVQEGDDTVSVWDVKSKQKLTEVTDVLRATWNTDASLILAVKEQSVSIVEPANGKIIFEDEDTRIWTASWSPDETRLLVVGGEGHARVWDTVKRMRLLDVRGIFGAAWNKNGTKILTRNHDRTVSIWDVSTGAQLHKLEPQSDIIMEASWSHDESKILTRSKDGVIRISDYEPGSEILKLDLKGDAIWSQNERRILIVGEDHIVRIIETETGVESKSLIAHNDRIYEAKWFSSDQNILTASMDGTIRIWNAEIGKELIEIENQPHEFWWPTLSNDGKWLLLRNYDFEQEQTRIFDLTTEKELLGFEGVKILLMNSNDGRILTQNKNNRTLGILDLETGRLLTEFNGHSDRIIATAWSPDGRKILTSGLDGTFIWDSTTGAELVRLDSRSDLNVIWNQDGNLILIYGGGNAYVWNATNGEQEVELPVSDPGAIVVWSPDENMVLSGGGQTLAGTDQVVDIWDAVNGRKLVEFFGHNEYTAQAHWSSDQRRVFTRSGDGTAFMWNAVTGETLFKLEDISMATWSKDERKILTSGYDGTVRIWYTDMKDLIPAACKWTPRNFTWLEWNTYLKGIHVHYRPTCPSAPIPPDTISRIQQEARQQIRAGKVISAAQRLEELNGWLQVNGQYANYGVDVSAFVAQAAETATAEAMPLSTETPEPTPTEISSQPVSPLSEPFSPLSTPQK